MRTLLTLALVALTASGCVKRYASQPPLEFSDLDYSGPAGQAWPLEAVTLPGAQARHGLGHAPTLRFVQLNPTGTPTLVFLHGLGSYLKFWRPQLDAAAALGYRVIAIDQLGFGKSDKPAGFPYTTEAFAENVDELLGLLGIERAVLFGHSMGGQTALATAIRFPARVAALVLASPAGFETFSGREKRWFKTVISRGFIKDADEEAIWGSVRRGNFHAWSPESAWLVEERVRLVRSKDFDAYAYAQVRTIEGLANNDFVRESLGRVQAPTLILYGTADRLIPNPFLHGGPTRWVMERGAAGIVGSTLVALEGCGHTVQLDCTAQFNAKAFDFVMSVAPAVAAVP